jgi:hypothetical protein
MPGLGKTKPLVAGRWPGSPFSQPASRACRWRGHIRHPGAHAAERAAAGQAGRAMGYQCGALVLLAGLAAQVDAQGKPAPEVPPPPAPPAPAPAPAPPPPTREYQAEASGVFQGLPACVEPGSQRARERNCKTEINVVHVTEGCFEYHAPNPDETGWTEEQLQHYQNLEGSHMGWYFAYNATTDMGQCLPVPAGMCVKCIPFLSEASCTNECSEWMDETELSHERDVEDAEELLATGEVVYHFFVASCVACLQTICLQSLRNSRQIKSVSS